MYKRAIHTDIAKKIGSGKAIIVVGARQVGKTTLYLKGKMCSF
jgi:predicted AAA+ superfamily ATPase